MVFLVTRQYSNTPSKCGKHTNGSNLRFSNQNLFSSIWMAPEKTKWVCRFEVEDPKKHRKGFTVYKLISVVYPESFPEAGTKLVIWKRFNDFKKLEASIIEQCKLLKITPPPVLLKGSFFNRFQEKVIQDRLNSAQTILDFIGSNRVLFLGEVFREFCKEGYNVKDINMGQGESVSCQQPGDINLSDDHWRWTEQSKWSHDCESSDDESGAMSEDTAGSRASPALNNNVSDCMAADSSKINNNSSPQHDSNYHTDFSHQFNREDSSEVLDIAGGGEKPLSCPIPDDDTEVVCHSEHPVATLDIWPLLPPPEQRLQAYKIVAIMDPNLIVVHSSRPLVRLVLKVLRKSSWPVTPSNIGEPRPVPNMVRLIDWIETEDAVFIVTELVSGGKLWNHVRQQQVQHQTSTCHPDNTSDRLPTPDPSIDVDSLVMQAQKLLASVNKTLERSAQQIKNVESSLDSCGRKPRSKSVLPRARLERRFSSDDATGIRPRTAHPSLERTPRSTLLRASEPNVRIWAAALIAGIDTLHTYGVVWKDLHPDNLLWGGDGRLLMTFQHRWSGVERPLLPSALTGLFVAPEVLSVFPVNPSCDWWSIGVILYELLTGTPLAEVHPTGLTAHTPLDIPEFLSLEARSLLGGLLEYDPIERLGAGTYGSEEIKCHPFFTSVDWDEAYCQ